METKAILLTSMRFERRLTRETIAAMTDGDMAYRPTPEQMAFGAQALHILSTYVTLMEALSDGGWQWEQGISLERYPTREAILTFHDEETARLMAFTEGLAPERLYEVIQTAWGAKEPVLQTFLSWNAHEAHHRGQMVTYLRLKGMQPPAY